jgi:hypothetical protein
VKANIARYGVMDTLTTDNGPQFSSYEFREFVLEYGIKHVTSSPHFHQANGLAERAVQSIKKLLKKSKQSNGDVYKAILDLRNTPRGDIGSPAQRLMGRRMKTLLPTSPQLLKPKTVNTDKVQSSLAEERSRQKSYYDRHTKPLPELNPSEAIRVSTPKGWKPAELIGKDPTPRSYQIKMGEQARQYRRNRQMIMNTREIPQEITPERPYFPYTKLKVDLPHKTTKDQEQVQPHLTHYDFQRTDEIQTQQAERDKPTCSIYGRENQETKLD